MIVTVGAGGSIDADSLTSPIVGFIFDQQGLMYSLSSSRALRSPASRDEPRRRELRSHIPTRAAHVGDWHLADQTVLRSNVR